MAGRHGRIYGGGQVAGAPDALTRGVVCLTFLVGGIMGHFFGIYNHVHTYSVQLVLYSCGSALC